MKVTIISTINKQVCVNKQTKHNFYTREHQLSSVEINQSYKREHQSFITLSSFLAS